jgi:signal peptidase I
MDKALNATAESKSEPSPRTSFAEVVYQKLGPEGQALLNRLRWKDRLSSPWAPITVLLAVFVAYLTVVEFAVCSYPWLMPVMQFIGAVCFWTWAAIVLARFVLRKWVHGIKARNVGEELLSETEGLVGKHRGSLSDKAFEALTEASHALVRSFSQAPEAIERATEALKAQVDKHLAQFQSGSAFSFMGGLARALLFAFLIRSVVLDPFKIPSGSMLPTLEIGDQIFVNRFLYGVRIPFTNYVPFTLIREPQKGDIIVFENPEQPGKDYIKRIVGTPGDEIRVDDKTVILNGKPLDNATEALPYNVWEKPVDRFGFDYFLNPRDWFHNDWRPETSELSREILDGRPHLMAHSVMGRNLFNKTVVVPPKHVFVMGDNRDRSLDSRYGLAEGASEPKFVPFGNIKGKATVIWLSLGHGGLLSSIFGGTGIRTDRFFLPVTMCGNEAPRPTDTTGPQ